MTQIKNFFLNNEHYTTEDEINLHDLITYFNYNESLLVLEYNQVIFDKNHWKTTVLQDLDEIEIVTIVGGGEFYQSCKITHSGRDKRSEIHQIL